jgi:hypothetical protein
MRLRQLVEKKRTFKTEAYYDADGKFHRLDGPAYVSYYDNGQLYREVWREHGRYKRDDGPCLVNYSVNGVLTEQIWNSNDKPDEVPTKYIDTETGGIVMSWGLINPPYEFYSHRLDGPAEIVWDQKKNEMRCFWYIDNYMYGYRTSSINEPPQQFLKQREHETDDPFPEKVKVLLPNGEYL